MCMRDHSTELANIAVECVPPNDHTSMTIDIKAVAYTGAQIHIFSAREFNQASFNFHALRPVDDKLLTVNRSPLLSWCIFLS